MKHREEWINNQCKFWFKTSLRFKKQFNIRLGGYNRTFEKSSPFHNIYRIKNCL